MAAINNDRDLRVTIARLDLAQQRVLAGRFVESVISLTGNERLHRAAAVAADPERSSEDMIDAFKSARAIAVETYTACGRDADWMGQAEHFVAAACVGALMPEDQIGKGTNPAWKAAMQARMAKNCEMIESGEGGVDNEAQRQYAIAVEFCGD
jgi:hypothetical protein